MAEPTHPWIGKSWEAAAGAANHGREGQGYIVHTAMIASGKADRLTCWVIALMVVQIFTAAVQIAVALKWIAR